MDTRIIHAALYTPVANHRWGQPLRLIGAPGTAKSSLVEQVSRESGLHTEVVIASLRDPTDFLGLPYPRPDGSIGYAPPAWAVNAAAFGRSVVFFDEINTAPPSVQAALLRVVLDRVVGDFSLPAGVRILAAQNSVEDAAGGYDLAAPLANRFGTLGNWEGPAADQWCSWLLQAGNGNVVDVKVQADEEEQRVMGEWPGRYAMAAGMVSCFVRRNPSILHKQPKAGSPQASGAWPSRRSWEMATRAIAASAIHKLTEEETDRYVGAFVGDAAMRELRVYMADLDLPDPGQLLDDVTAGRNPFVHDGDRLDRTMAVMSSCAAVVAPKTAEKRITRAKALWKLLAANMQYADVIQSAVQTLVRKEVRLVGIGGQFETDTLGKFRPIFQAAGII